MLPTGLHQWQSGASKGTCVIVCENVHVPVTHLLSQSNHLWTFAFSCKFTHKMTHFVTFAFCNTVYITMQSCRNKEETKKIDYHQTGQTELNFGWYCIVPEQHLHKIYCTHKWQIPLFSNFQNFLKVEQQAQTQLGLQSQVLGQMHNWLGFSFHKPWDPAAFPEQCNTPNTKSPSLRTLVFRMMGKAVGQVMSIQE